MRKPRPPGLTRDRAPGKPEGRRQTLRTRRLRARRGVDSVQVVSPRAFWPRGPQSRAQAGSASPAVLGRQSSLQRLEWGARVHRDPSRLCRQQLRQAGSCGIQEEPESSSQLQRLVNLPPSEAQGGVRACVCVCPRARARRHACAPLHMHAPTYWPRGRREPWLPTMPCLPIHTRTVAPLLGRERARWLLTGRKQGSRPVSC